MAAKTSIKLDKHLCERARAVADAAGYSSLEEFIAHLIEQRIADIETDPAAAAGISPEMLRRLKGLGYIE